ncbi:hypothetical protein Salat_1051100 [Sesamum alatum]|uniref:Possible tRNA binding domain-containing protein n=1 Tax=Sesamum alatum TaxID=300844 RepID=A0AAE2CSV0_9LAMI|nr:hypothetical protein Salat_1051100 [Sesamum alatum]
MASSIFVINSNSGQILPPLEDCRLYRLNITELLSKPDVYECFFKVLSDVSDSEINREMLTVMAANRRHELYVLIGPVENWNGDAPIIYSAIQVCIEGNIADLPDLSGGKFSDCFFLFWDMVELVGVNILKVYALEQDYANTAVQLMTRYYNGDAAEDVLPLVPELEGHIFIKLQRRTWPLVHYLGVFDKPNLAQFDQWTSNGFSPIFIGKIQRLDKSKYRNDEKEVVCAMIKWLKDYEPLAAQNAMWSHPELFSIARERFRKFLSTDLKSIDHSFACRILEMEFSRCRPATLTERPWDEIEDCLIVRIIRGAPVSLEVLVQEIRTVADLYFDAVLPISFSEVDRSLLLLCGFQYRRIDEIMRIMNLSEEDIKQSFRRILEKAFDCVNGLFPEVSD